MEHVVDPYENAEDQETAHDDCEELYEIPQQREEEKDEEEGHKDR